jgi:DNA-binding YbaB/EbfC family protein
MAKGFGNIMKQAKMMQEKIGKIQEEMANKTVEASAGGGMITTVINGRQEMVSIKIDPEVVNPDDVEMLEDLILAAVNEGIKRSQEMMAEEMSKITGGMKIPGLT